MRHHYSLNVSLETVLATSSLLGHELEDRGGIRDAHDASLVERLAERTSQALRSSSQRDLFCVAPLDILVEEREGRKRFHLLELNGTGIGGLTNMPSDIVHVVLDSLTEFCEGFEQPGGLVLLAVSGKEDDTSPRLNRLMHEKLLFADAMRIGLKQRWGACDVATLAALDKRPPARCATYPTVVVGYIKDLLHALECDADGGLWLQGRRVTGAVNDRFCRNIMQRFEERIDLQAFKTLNRCFVPGSDKGVAYQLVNEFVQRRPHAAWPDGMLYAHAQDRETLVQTVMDWLHRERQVVIKPHGTGLGHGIEFFLDPAESRRSVARRIDTSLRQTEEFYGIAGGAFPYTVCEYVDACRVRDTAHRLSGHKYELRVVVYRDCQSLKAVPTIAKVARERVQESGFERRALINNITASGDTRKIRGTDFMLPLCHPRTLDTLGLTESDLRNLCEFATGLVRHTLDQIEDAPERYGLPATDRATSGAALQAA
jgi:hypothetical protein